MMELGILEYWNYGILEECLKQEHSSQDTKEELNLSAHHDDAKSEKHPSEIW